MLYVVIQIQPLYRSIHDSSAIVVYIIVYTAIPIPPYTTLYLLTSYSHPYVVIHAYTTYTPIPLYTQFRGYTFLYTATHGYTD